MSQNYLFEKPTRHNAENLNKESQEVLNPEQKKEDDYHYKPTKLPQISFEDIKEQNSETSILPQSSHQEDPENYDFSNFRIVVPDQEYEEDAKVVEMKELTGNLTQNDNQYSPSNRKPITFDTRPVAYLQENEELLEKRRPYYKQENSSESRETSKLLNFTPVTADEENKENNIEVVKSIDQQLVVPTENFNSSLEYNKK